MAIAWFAVVLVATGLAGLVVLPAFAGAWVVLLLLLGVSAIPQAGLRHRAARQARRDDDEVAGG